MLYASGTMQRNTKHERSKVELPLVRLITARPIFDAHEKQGVPGDQILRKIGLTRDALENPATLVHATSLWNADDVVVTVSEPKALPSIFHGVRSIKENKRGYEVRLLTLWLNVDFNMPEFLKQGVADNEGRL